MSAAERTIKTKEISKSKSVPVLDRLLNFLSAVRFGVVLLCILVALSMIGMLIIQQNVEGFDAYYASLTPAEKLVFGYLGFFDIYHSWYYNLLLLILSLNIVLASIDRFPSAWAYISKPKLSATRGWLLRQKQNAIVPSDERDEKTIAEKISRVFKANGLNVKITEDIRNFYAEENGGKNYQNTESKKYLFVFGERGKWNRLGAYIVHVFLLTLFLGHFVALQTGFDADVRLTPDTNPAIQQMSSAPRETDQIQLIQFNLDRQERFNVQLPFTITCTEIEQKLIDPKGSIEINNTLDWRTQIKISDPEYGETVADVSLNKPFSYRGFRFFQASAITIGSASNLTLEVVPQTEVGLETQTVNLKRNGAAKLPDGTMIEYESFFPDFVMQGAQFDTRSAEYNNPVAVLKVTPPGGATERVFAFANKLPDNAPINAPKAGYRWRLKEFEKSPIAHVLSIKYDPHNAAFVAWYIGGFGLIGALGFVFFMSHKRVWAMIDSEKNEVILGGDTNRNDFAFEDKFKKIVTDLQGGHVEQNERE